jgi:hypothetical protein
MTAAASMAPGRSPCRIAPVIFMRAPSAEIVFAEQRGTASPFPASSHQLLMNSVRVQIPPRLLTRTVKGPVQAGVKLQLARL